MKALLTIVHALSPLHAGTGQSVGGIDLPVAREKSTGIPYLPGSSLKGVLRDSCADVDVRTRVFGPDTDRAKDHAGSVQISDQRLLLLPVRSLVGTFAWVTSPFVMRRLRRDLEAVEIAEDAPDAPDLESLDTCLVAPCDSITLPDGHVVFEDLKLKAQRNEVVAAWAGWIGERLFPGDERWQRMVRERLCVVHDDVLGFLLETGTEVTARIRLDENLKTVEEGGLWYEEALPAETVLCGLAVAIPVKADSREVFSTLESIASRPLQIGGKSTTGRGLCRLRVIGGDRS